ncbi:hypothetical protein RRF57_013131 [Xylaria bambusicola]|uniref:NADH dehydrogenase [ubiquinone] 1 alpha subcomplex subunit n=1 Tax=Xylaria bambusicola TaxID=326684 RepID=A0AAN7UYZ4_9PEZI
MSQKQTSFVLRAWHQWKSLRLPWRKRFFVGEFPFPPIRQTTSKTANPLTHTFTGSDPQGNTYYELRQPRGDAPEGSPHRRLVYYPRSTHYSEVKVPPAWHQWLRHQRFEPPSMEEQVAELQRQARMKLLAAEADARWEAKPSLLDMPPSCPQQALNPTTTAITATTAAAADQRTTSDRRGQIPSNSDQVRSRDFGEKKTSPVQTQNTNTKIGDNDPWKQAQQRGAPGETWQPQAWTPASTPARRR